MTPMEMEAGLLAITLIVLLIAVVLGFSIYFSYLLYSVLKRIPEENQQFPRWFVWLIIIPGFGLIFQWVMQPFGIPNALKKTFKDDPAIVAKANSLFNIGLAQVILMTISLFSGMSLIQLFVFVPGSICWMIYWIKIVQFRKQYLSHDIKKDILQSDGGQPGA